MKCLEVFLQEPDQVFFEACLEAQKGILGRHQFEMSAQQLQRALQQ